LKNDLFGFPKVNWLQVRWANVQAIDVKFSQDFTHQKSLKSVNDVTELFEKIKRWTFIGTQCIAVCTGGNNARSSSLTVCKCMYNCTDIS